MTPSDELTFSVVDDLVGAHARGRLGRPQSERRYVSHSVGPLIELACHSFEGHFSPIHASPWLDQSIQIDLREALRGSAPAWFDTQGRRGFLRTVFDPLAPEEDLTRVGFLLAARKAVEAAGFPVLIAQSLTAALREMESNIHEHSKRADTGIMAFQSDASGFEFVIADRGVGILASLREAPEFKNLADHGRAIYAALQEGASRHGRNTNHGMGFKNLFVGLANLNANLRFRSGDHALTIDGPSPSLKIAQLIQKPYYQGFLVAVRCDFPRAAHATH